MSFNFNNLKISFFDRLSSHLKLAEQENVDPEDVAKSRLNLIQEAKKGILCNQSPALYWYGRCMITGEEGFSTDLEQGIKYLEKALELENPDANNLLGDIYSVTINNIPNEYLDYEKAIQYYKTLPCKNLGYAYYKLAMIYSGELGYDADINEAAHYIIKSADLRYEDAINYKLHWMYDGKILEKNDKKIIQEIEEFIKKFDNNIYNSNIVLASLYHLYGHMIYKGHGCEKNEDKGVLYISDAAKMGNEDSVLWLENYRKEKK